MSIFFFFVLIRNERFMKNNCRDFFCMGVVFGLIVVVGVYMEMKVWVFCWIMDEVGLGFISCGSCVG